VTRLSEKVRLVAEVERLCAELKRPVSSRDLAKSWAKVPDRRPLLLQRPGQLLIKAARPFEGSAYLCKIGVVGNLAFYAIDSSPQWSEALRLHSIRLRMKQHCKWGVPQQAAYLFGTKYEAYATNALAGYRAEWDSLDASAQRIAIETGFVKMLDIARTQGPAKFSGKCPPLSVAKKAETILRGHCKSQRETDAAHLSANRHLARLSWPKIPLFSKRGFWMDQVTAYSRSRWPGDCDDPIEQRALFICMFYGIPKPR